MFELSCHQASYIHDACALRLLARMKIDQSSRAAFTLASLPGAMQRDMEEIQTFKGSAQYICERFLYVSTLVSYLRSLALKYFGLYTLCPAKTKCQNIWGVNLPRPYSNHFSSHQPSPVSRKSPLASCSTPTPAVAPQPRTCDSSSRVKFM